MNFWRVLMAGSALTMVGVVTVFALLQPKPVDEAGCRLDNIVSQHTIVLIDQSDPFTQEDIRWVQKIARDESRSLGQYGRLTVVGLKSETPYEPVEAFSRCSPGAKSNGWTNNPRMVEDTFREQMSDLLDAALETLLSEKEQPTSPLIEALVGISDRSDFSPAVAARKIVLVSDLIQNSPELSHLKTGADFAAVERTRFATDKPRLEGVAVSVRVVPRRNYAVPKEELVDFWNSMLEYSGAQEPEVF